MAIKRIALLQIAELKQALTLDTGTTLQPGTDIVFIPATDASVVFMDNENLKSITRRQQLNIAEAARQIQLNEQRVHENTNEIIELQYNIAEAARQVQKNEQRLHDLLVWAIGNGFSPPAEA